MSDAKHETKVHHETKAEHAAHAKKGGDDVPEQLFAAHDLSKPDEPTIHLFPTAEAAKKKCPKSKVVDVDPAVWKGKDKPNVFAPGEPGYDVLAWAIDNRGK